MIADSHWCNVLVLFCTNFHLYLMDDGSKHNNNQKNDVLIDSSSYIICGRKDFDKRTKRPSDLVRCNPLGGNKDVSEVEVEVMNGQVCPMHPMSPVKKNVAATPVELQNSNSFRAYLEPYCQTKEPCCQRKLVSFCFFFLCRIQKFRGMHRKCLTTHASDFLCVLTASIRCIRSLRTLPQCELCSPCRTVDGRFFKLRARRIVYFLLS